MSKVFGTVNLKKDNELVLEKLEIAAIKSEHKIVYPENNIHVTILYYDNKIEMTRKHSDYVIAMLFEHNKISQGYYLIKEFNKKLDLQINTKKLSFNDNRIDIDYLLTIDTEFIGHFQYSLELEV